MRSDLFKRTRATLFGGPLPREAGLPFLKNGSAITFGVRWQTLHQPIPTLGAGTRCLSRTLLSRTSTSTCFLVHSAVVPQTVQLNAIGAWREEFALKLCDLVDEWAAASGAHETSDAKGQTDRPASIHRHSSLEGECAWENINREAIGRCESRKQRRRSLRWRRPHPFRRRPAWPSLWVSSARRAANFARRRRVVRATAFSRILQVGRRACLVRVLVV